MKLMGMLDLHVVRRSEKRNQQMIEQFYLVLSIAASSVNNSWFDDLKCECGIDKMNGNWIVGKIETVISE